MPAHSRSKNGVASLAYVAGIHVLTAFSKKDVGGRDEPGHDEYNFMCSPRHFICVHSSLSPGSYSASRPMRSRQSSAVQGSISEPQRLSR